MRVLAVTGSSGGHIFPALSFLDSLKNKREGMGMLLVMPRKNAINKAAGVTCNLRYISISSVKLNLSFRNIASVLKLLKGALESIAILFSFRPDIVVGFGSVASVPMVVFAGLSGAKTLIHEQNVIPGRANRFLARFADKVAVSFPDTVNYLKGYKKKIVFTGNPIRSTLNRIDRNKALDFFGLSSNKFTILVMGGSQGSSRINSGFLKAISAIPDKTSLQVIHLAGGRDHDLLKKGYGDLNINFRLFDFLEPMQNAYSACDLVVSRAGATTIAEIVYFGLKAILIPYPFAYKHQLANAKALEDLGSGVIIQDSELDGEILAKKIESFIGNTESAKDTLAHYEGMAGAGRNDLLLDAVLSLA